MKRILINTVLILALCYIIYSSFDVFTRKIVCENVDISRNFYNHLKKNNLSDSLCFYKNKVENGDFKFINNIQNLGDSGEYSLESYTIIENLLINANQEKLKKYFNNEATIQTRLYLYSALRISNNKNTEKILHRIKPVKNGNDYRFE